MKLERIHIERYGAWQNLDLPVDSESISVYFGPNEAGKSTLMRFIRGILYGFRRQDPGQPVDDPSAPWGGSLQVEHNSRSWIIRRAGRSGGRGLVTAWPADTENATPSDGSALVADLVEGVSEAVFENIFAVGLYELQELATLEDHEVARHIYSMSLGLDGQQLLRLIERVRLTRDEILDTQTGHGQLGDLNAQVEELDQRVDREAGVRRKYEQLLEEHEKWEDTIVELKQRQQGLENQLHGHEYMDRVYEPWNKVRKLQRELDRLPDLPDFPHDGLTNLTTIESELAAVRGKRNALLHESRELKQRGDQISPSPEFRRYAPLLQAFVDQRNWIADLLSFASENDLKLTELRQHLRGRLDELGSGWSEDRLRRIDASHVSSHCLTHRSSEFRALDRRSEKLRRRYRKMQTRFHQQQEKLAMMKRRLGGVSVERAIEQTREELRGLEDISRLRIREAELVQRRVGVANQLHRLQIDPSLPKWVYATFSALGVAGVALSLIGIVTGLTTNWIAGLSYGILGVFCSGMTWALRDHFEQEVEKAANRLRSELRELDLRMAETRDALSRIVPTSRTVTHRDRAFADSRSNNSRPGTSRSGLDVVRTGRSLPLAGNMPSAGKTATVRRSASESHSTNTATDNRYANTTDQAGELRRQMALIEASPTRHESFSDEHVTVGSGSLPANAIPGGEVQTHLDGVARDAYPGSTRTGHSEADMMRACVDQLHELDGIIALQNWVERRRHVLIGMRQRLRDVQRDFGAARQNWSSHLIEQGLDETVEIEKAVAQRDLVARAAMIVNRIDELTEDTRLARRMVERFRKRIEETGHRLQQWNVDYTDPLAVLHRWEGELMRSAQQTIERRRLMLEAKKKRAEAGQYRARIRRLESQQEAIFVRGGAISREEFEDRASMLGKRFELNERLEHARQELSAAAAGDRAMAIVESDLESYNTKQNRECIATVRHELDDVTIDLEDAFENLGRFRREVELLENDRSSAELRFEREQLLSRVTELAEQWFALDWSVNALEELRLDFERNHQPPILARAKEYLGKLSGGRYCNIWTPMGQRTLCVDDTDGNTLMVEHLSGGTREQLFLAIRMALIEHFGNQGVELPVVFDDILVNFDEQRTQSAVTELIRQTSEHQQILFFTCHHYLAEMFRQRGVSTVMLPDRRALATELRAG